MCSRSGVYAVRNLKPSNKPKKIADGDGLFLFVSITGTKSWRFRYRYLGKPEEMTFGTYPEISLLEARTKRLEARKLLASGKNPRLEKKDAQLIVLKNANNTFRAIAKEWHDLNKDNWTERHGKQLWERLEKHVFPVIGSKPIKEIDGLYIYENIILKIEKEGHTEMSHRVLNYCSAIFRRAVRTKRIPYNPLSEMSEMLKRHKEKHHPTIKISELPQFLQKLEKYDTHELNKLAVKLLVLTFVRQGVLRKAKWEHFDFENKLWCIPAELMKMKREHLVPLSDQAIAILNVVLNLSGDSEYLFPTRNKIKEPYMNENVINNLIHDMGYKGKLVAHGFRALASTTLNEIVASSPLDALGFNSNVIKKQLAHENKDKVEAAYNRAEYLQQRIRMMQYWADYIDCTINSKN